jgi:hypothetical protein
MIYGPVFLSTSPNAGELYIMRSYREAIISMEAIDVQDGIYHCWDISGRVLAACVAEAEYSSSTTHLDTVYLEETNQYQLDKLVSLLKENLDRWKKAKEHYTHKKRIPIIHMNRDKTINEISVRINLFERILSIIESGADDRAAIDKLVDDFEGSFDI